MSRITSAQYMESEEKMKEIEQRKIQLIKEVESLIAKIDGEEEIESSDLLTLLERRISIVEISLMQFYPLLQSIRNFMIDYHQKNNEQNTH